MCDDVINKALNINVNHAKANYFKGAIYYDSEKYDEASIAFGKAIEANPLFPYPYQGLGNVYWMLNEYDKAIEYYKMSLEINPEFTYSYHGLGSVYRALKDYDKSINFYNESLKIDSDFAFSYQGLGIVYRKLKEYDKAIEFFNKGITIEPKLKAFYYNRAQVYEDKKAYQMALEDFEKYVELTKNNPDYFTTVAQAKITELKKLIRDTDYSKISELVNKIKDLLLFKDHCVTHYTGISVAKLLILDGSKLRLSEGAFLNDTSEGRELFKFLPPLTEPTTTNDTVALHFTPKPFIGSFVAETKHDDLTLWRMYGKENKEEAKGCAITLDKNLLLENLKNALTSDGKADSPKADDEEFSFYSVAYIQSGQIQSFIVPGVGEQVVKELNQYMNELAIMIKQFKNKEGADIPSLLELLNSIAYLFKTAEYSYEHELRLIVKGIGFPKQIFKESQPPRVYIDIVSIQPLIRKITLGPKVDRAEEWASAFYYSLDAKGYHPEIMISHLPFK